MRRSERDGKQSEEAGGIGNEGAGETAGVGGGRSCPLLPVWTFQMPTRRCENHTPPPSSSIIPPNRGGDSSPAASAMERCGTHTPLHFERICRRQQQGRCESNMPPPFIFILNGGGVNPTRRLRFFSFRTGACESPPPFLSVSFRGSVIPHAAPCFFSFQTGAA